MTEGRTRTWALVTAAIGLALVLLPRRAVAATGHRSSGPPAAVVRALGARHLLQGSVLALRPGQDLTLVATAVEILHGTSMIAAAIAVPRYRRPALVSAMLAGISALTGLFLYRNRRQGLSTTFTQPSDFS